MLAIPIVVAMVQAFEDSLPHRPHRLADSRLRRFDDSVPSSRLYRPLEERRRAGENNRLSTLAWRVRVSARDDHPAYVVTAMSQPGITREYPRPANYPSVGSTPAGLYCYGCFTERW